MIRADQMRRRVRIQQKTTGVDSVGFPINDQWTDVVTVWAEVKPLTLRAREVYQAAGIEAQKSIQVTIRYRSGIAENMRILYGVRTFDIWSVLDTEERHVELQLICREVTDGG